MISSMTGFGTGERAGEQWLVGVEVRSVNRKDLQVSLRLPDEFALKETELRKLIGRVVHRGHLYVSVACDPRTDREGVLVDEQRAADYLRCLKRVASRLDVPLRVDPASVLSLPGVLRDVSGDQQLREPVWADIVAATAEAVDGLVQMRRAEGENLGRQLGELCERISDLTDRIEEAQGGFLQGYRERLRQRIERLLEGTEAELDQQSLEREVALYAERSDVSEEIARLRSHVDQFREALGGPAEPVGRKMEFIGQEMLREAGTMAAKVPAGEQVREVLDLKTTIEQLREQVRNVE